jgi:RimJ/RimL family protein N-acetyltransferase
LLHTPEPVLDPERVLAGLRRWVAMTEDPIGMYALVERGSGETVGFVGFVRRELDWGDEIELGWLIRRAHWAAVTRLKLRAPCGRSCRDGSCR